MGKWVIYKDPDPIFSQIREDGMKIDKKNRQLDDVDFSKAYYCDESGKHATVEQLSSPDFKPWVIVYGKSISRSNIKWQFLYQPATETILVKPNSYESIKQGVAWRKIKCTRLIHKKLKAKLELIEPEISKDYLLGYSGNSVLSTGFFFAPYVPVYTTPTINI